MLGDERLAVLAHNLLNPMTAIVSALDIALRQAELPPEVAAALDAAKRQAEYVGDSLRELVRGVPPEVLAGPGQSALDLKQT